MTVADTLASELSLNPYLNFGDVDMSGLTEEAIGGYTITSRSSQAAIIKPLMKAYRFGVYEEDYQLKFKSRVNGTVVATIPATDLQAHQLESEMPEEVKLSLRPDQLSPGQISLSYVDADANYEKSTQIAERLNTINDSSQEVDLPMVLETDQAAKIVNIWLETVWLENQGVIEVSVPFKYSFLEVEDLVTIQATNKTYTIRLIEVEKGKPGIVRLVGVLNDIAGYSSSAVGQSPLSTSVTISPTSTTALQVVDCVPLQDGDEDYGIYYNTFPENPTGAWSGAAVWASGDAQRWNTIGALQEGVSVCTALDTLGDNGTVGAWDETEDLLVKIVNGSLETVTDAVAALGSNLAVYGKEGRWEAIKFTTVTDNGDGTISLSRFLRGYYGTEEEMALHEVGDALIIFSIASWGRLADQGANLYDVTQYYRAITNGTLFNKDDVLVYKAVSEAKTQRAPQHLKASRATDGEITLTWSRSKLSDRTWIDSDWTETEVFDFEVDILSEEDGVVLRTVEVSGSNAPFTTTYSAANQVTDFGSTQTELYVNVYQTEPVTGRGKVKKGLAI